MKSFKFIKLMIVLIFVVLAFFPLSISARNDVFPNVEETIEKKLETQNEVLVFLIINESGYVKYNEAKTDREINEVYRIRKTQIKEKQTNILKKLDKADFKIKYEYDSFSALAGYITTKGLTKLKNDQSIARIYIPLRGNISLDSTRNIINFGDVWQKSYNNVNITGDGESICILDTGIDYTHKYMGACNLNQFLNGSCKKVPAGYDFVSDDSDPNDITGHGTHVAGIVASESPTYRGVAPNSRIISMKVINFTGWDETDIAAGIDWCTANRTKFNISVVSMSLGNPDVFFSNTCDTTTGAGLAIETAFSNNIFISIASGNEFYSDRIRYPACHSNATAVGSTTKNDSIANSSNSGPNLDLLAPGKDITSLRTTTTELLSGCTPHESSLYMTCSGTSMATPHVSGSAALLQQFNKLRYGNTLTPLEIRRTLNETGVPLFDSRNNLTFSRIDVMSAIDSLTTIKVGDPIKDRILRQSQTWKTKLNVSKGSNIDLFAELSWSPTTDKLNMSLLGPDGSIHNGTLLEGSQEISITRPASGIWTIKVFGSKISNRDKFVTFDIKTDDNIKTGSTPPDASKGEPGGINFTFSRLNYISACNNSNDGLTVVLKGEKANSSQPIVDISNKTNLTSKSFLAGLVLPNHKMIVSMYPFGSVSIDSFLAKTEAGRVMLDADVKLKFTFYSSQQSKNEYLDLVNYWNSLLNQGPYVNELKNAGYIGGFSWEARQWISPNSLKAEGEGCKIFLTNATLNVDSELRWSHSGIDSYNVRQEVKDYVKDLFTNNFTANITNWLNRNGQRAQNAIDTEDQYADLRYVYASLAMAQWYKTLDRSQVLFGDLIDGNGIYDYNLNISYDEEYWKQQSKQRLTENLYFNCFTSGACYTWIFGGVSYINLNTNITSVLSNDTKQVVTNAVSSLYAQKSTENNSFYYENLNIGNVTIYFLFEYNNYTNIEFGINLNVFEDYSDYSANMTNASLQLNESAIEVIYRNTSVYENETLNFTETDLRAMDLLNSSLNDTSNIDINKSFDDQEVVEVVEDE